MTGYISDPFFSLIIFDTQNSNYNFVDTWQPVSTPVPAKNISPGGNDSAGFAHKSGSPKVYSTSPRKGNAQTDGTDILADGRNIRLSLKAKLINDSSQLSGKTIGRLGRTLGAQNSSSSYPLVEIRIDFSNSTYFADLNNNGEIVFNKGSGGGFNLSNIKFDEADEFEYEFATPNLEEIGSISVKLGAPDQTALTFGNPSIPTWVIYNYLQIKPVKDQETNIRSYDQLDADTTVGRYEKEMMFGEGGFPVTNALKYINDTTVTVSDRFKALTPTSTWLTDATSSDKQGLLKSLVRQYMRNLRKPSFVLSAEFWWGNLNAHPFHLKLEESLQNNATRSFTLIGQSLKLDIANRRIEGEWVQNLDEVSSPGFLDPPDEGIPNPGDGDTPSPEPGPIPNPLPDEDTFEEVFTNGHQITILTPLALIFACNISAATPDVFLPNIKNVQCGTEFIVEVACDGCNKNVNVNTNSNDSATAFNSSFPVTVPCGGRTKFVKKCNTNKWIIL